MFKQIKSLDELKQICDGETHDFFIQLKYGLRSSKNISYNKEQDKFFIFNEIDGTEDVLDSKQIMDEDYTNVGKAIINGALYQY